MRVRTLFLSDTHLGYKRARARELAELIEAVEAELIVLAGDIVDALSLARRLYWCDAHTRVLRALAVKRRAGARLIFIPGNHDSSLAGLDELLRSHVEIHREWVHRTARGERLLVVHGDQFDMKTACPRWLQHLGSAAYDLTLVINDAVNGVRRLLGRPYASLAERLKLAIPTSAHYVACFEGAAVAHARARGFDGVVCGHIHRARLEQVDGFTYCNTGDWVESCSAVVETEAGELRLLRWPLAASTVRSDYPTLVPDAA